MLMELQLKIENGLEKLDGISMRLVAIGEGFKKNAYKS